MAEQNQGEREERTVRLASIVAVDIVGFSTMSERDQRKAARHVESLRARIEQIAATRGGRLFNTAGDGFMLEFASAGAALEAVQDVLDKRQRGEPRVRVGAHVGDVVVTVTNDLLGHGVNVAARLQELAAPGAALVSAEFRSMARNSPSAAFQAKGRQPLDNIEQRVQTFEILSRRQKAARMAKRVGWTATAMAAAAALIFFSPILLRTVDEMFNLRGVADASAPSAQGVMGSALGQVAVAPAMPRGHTFRDCAMCPEMVVLPGGLFVMGSPAGETGRNRDEGPQREVSIAPIAVSKFEITFAQWDACLGAGGCNGYSPADRGWGRGDHPVIGVSWNDAQAYLDWLNAQAGGLRYRLLTEAEWEFAARAGSTTTYAFGDRLTAQQATYRARQTTPVGAHPLNAFQLADLHGNVGEWVEDCYAPTYQLAPIDGGAVQAERCARRVYRGGGYSDQPAAVRAAVRRAGAPDLRAGSIGFRVARSLD